MSIPNLFEIGTNELTQDIFLTWLFKWGDSKSDAGKLQDLSREFLNFLIGENVDINKVNIKRQWNNVDIAITVNDKYFIILEDKVNAKEHGNQLDRYKKEAEKNIGENLKLICIYLKIEDECGSTVRKVEKKSYRYIYRKDILNLFEKYNDIDNDIFQDYYKHIKKIDDESKNFQTEFVKSITKSYRTCRGFFKYLEEELNQRLSEDRKKMFSWRYVPQRDGGFYGFWYYSISFDEYSVYIQIEVKKNTETGNKGYARVVLKTKEKAKIGNKDYLKKLYNILEKNAFKDDIKLDRPSRFNTKGDSSTVAVFDDIFNFNQDYDYTVKKLKEIEGFLEKIDINI